MLKDKFSARLSTLLLLSIAIVLGSCETIEPPNPPSGTNKIAFTETTSVTINNYSAVSLSTAKPRERFGIEIDEYGHAIGQAPNPERDDNSEATEEGASSFTSEIDNLITGTEYYVRAYLRFGNNVVYGLPQTFTITNSNPVAAGSVDKNLGEVSSTVFTFDASSSTDPEPFNSSQGEQSLEARWDFNGDGTYDTDWADYDVPITNYQYTVAGNYNPIVQVRDQTEATDRDTLDNLGIYDAQDNPISLTSFNFPKYSFVNEQVSVNIEAIDRDLRPLTYTINYGGGVEQSGSTQNFTYTQKGEKTLQATITNDYNVPNRITKEVKVGEAVQGTINLIDNVDGKRYAAVEMSDGSMWLVQNFARAQGSANYYDNDSLNNSVFGRYYAPTEIDALGTIVLMEDNGVAHNFEVANANDWESLISDYGSSEALKYPDFSNGTNQGATNTSGLSLMLGGRGGDFFVGVENYGFFMTATDNNGVRKYSYISKDDTEIKVLEYSDQRRAPIRLIERN